MSSCGDCGGLCGGLRGNSGARLVDMEPDCDCCFGIVDDNGVRLLFKAVSKRVVRDTTTFGILTLLDVSFSVAAMSVNGSWDRGVLSSLSLLLTGGLRDTMPLIVLGASVNMGGRVPRVVERGSCVCGGRGREAGL